MRACQEKCQTAHDGINPIVGQIIWRVFCDWLLFYGPLCCWYYTLTGSKWTLRTTSGQLSQVHSNCYHLRLIQADGNMMTICLHSLFGKQLFATILTIYLRVIRLELFAYYQAICAMVLQSKVVMSVQHPQSLANHLETPCWNRLHDMKNSFKISFLFLFMEGGCCPVFTVSLSYQPALNRRQFVK